jgi:hypothetical protein
MSACCVALGIMLLAAIPASAQKFQTFKDCAVGKRVETNGGRTGTITRLDREWSYCYVRFDDDGKEVSYLYSLLNGIAGGAGGGAVGGAPRAAGETKIQVGEYECITGATTVTMNLRITGADAYLVEGKAGKFRLEASGRIVFETGPMRQFNSRLLDGARIGLNTDGGAYYPTACEFRHR